MFICIVFFSKYREGGYTITNTSPKLLIIDSTSWKMIDVSKSKHDLEMVDENPLGEKLRWYLSVNNTDHPYEIPVRAGEKLHLDYTAKKLFVSLKPGQGVTSATLKVTKKK